MSFISQVLLVLERDIRLRGGDAWMSLIPKAFDRPGSIFGRNNYAKNPDHGDKSFEEMQEGEL
jgi:hypothetical protein